MALNIVVEVVVEASLTGAEVLAAPAPGQRPGELGRPGRGSRPGGGAAPPGDQEGNR